MIANVCILNLWVSCFNHDFNIWVNIMTKQGYLDDKFNLVYLPPD